MKFIRFLALLAFVQFSAQASLIQWDAFNAGDQLAVKDLETGTIWLDLSVTAGTGYFQAGDLFDEWGYADNGQVEDLLAKAFPSFTISTPTNYQNNCTIGNECYEQSLNWLDLFGSTENTLNAQVKYGFGLYEDEDGLIRMGGSRVNGSLQNVFTYGEEFTVDYTGYTTSAPTYWYSTFLTFQPVQSPDNSIDAQLSESGLASMFAGLLGFMLIRRRKA
ncbi:hypothetical protein [Aliiglaciecola sp. M165]|uniref:hypothetical protein n=1 Tax=Aliiglaciecola sp. M165 TaxID=2593649 RepID=UPI00117C7B38|nr:hypothetical protein [Aliiglaciecola sp. M165]TRY32063.1 hypothetical protein FM019_09610 [Aliiglaciecola sp. M165]